MNNRRCRLAGWPLLGVLSVVLVALLPGLAQALPDLVVSQVAIRATTESNVTVATKVKNVGDADAAPCSMLWFTCGDINGGTGDRLAPQFRDAMTVPLLKAGQVANLTWSVGWPWDTGAQFVFEVDGLMPGCGSPLGVVLESQGTPDVVHVADWALGESNNVFVVPYVGGSNPGTYAYHNPRAGSAGGAPVAGPRVASGRFSRVLKTSGPDLRLRRVDVTADATTAGGFKFGVIVENTGDTASKACTLGALWRPVMAAGMPIPNYGAMVDLRWIFPSIGSPDAVAALGVMAPQTLPAIPARSIGSALFFPCLKGIDCARVIFWADTPVRGNGSFGLNPEPSTSVINGLRGTMETDNALVIPFDADWKPQSYLFDTKGL